MDRKVIVMRKDGVVYWFYLNNSVVVHLFLSTILMLISHLYPNNELSLMKQSLLLRLDLYLCMPYVLYSLCERVNSDIFYPPYILTHTNISK